MTIAIIIGAIYAVILVVAVLFFMRIGPDEIEPMGEEAGQVYSVSVDNEVKKD